MKKYALAVARCRRRLGRYTARVSGMLETLALCVGGETYPLVERVLGLVEKKRQLALVAATDMLMSAALTAEENEALTVCTNGEGSRRAAVRLGLPREEILRRARRALDKCCDVLKKQEVSCEDFIYTLPSEMEKALG